MIAIGKNNFKAVKHGMILIKHHTVLQPVKWLHYHADCRTYSRKESSFNKKYGSIHIINYHVAT